MLPMCYLNSADPYFRSMMPSQSPFSGPMPGIGALPGFNAPQPQAAMPSDFEKAPGSPTDLDSDYTQGYLKTQIGKRMKVTFLIGTNLVQDREGVLVKVGISYIILKEANNLVLCDIYAIKFINIYPA